MLNTIRWLDRAELNVFELLYWAGECPRFVRFILAASSSLRRELQALI